jgi:hypothetical protein
LDKIEGRDRKREVVHIHFSHPTNLVEAFHGGGGHGQAQAPCPAMGARPERQGRRGGRRGGRLGGAMGGGYRMSSVLLKRGSLFGPMLHAKENNSEEGEEEREEKKGRKKIGNFFPNFEIFEKNKRYL